MRDARVTGRALAVRAGLVAAVVLAVTLWLVARAIDGVREQERARHRAVAEDLFDELEGELSALVDAEERRSFLEYRHLYVPEGVPIKGTAGLALSPLAGVPGDAAIVGYFQLDPGGGCTNPAFPRENELDVARAAGWRATDELEDRQARIGATLAEVGPLPAAIARGADLSPAVAAEDETIQLKRGASARSGRSSQVVQTGRLNLEAYNSGEDVLRNVLLANTLDPIAGPAPLDDPATDVRVSPIAGVRAREALVLYREVRIGGETHQQGLVVDLTALARELQGRVLDPSPLGPFVSLTWDPDADAGDGYAFAHTFAAPFDGWSVAAAVAPIPELGSSEPWVLVGLATLVLGVVVAGGTSIGWAVRAELELAQRRSDFAAAVTHELKTPLTSIRMYGEMLRDGVIADPDRQREYHATLVTEAERLTRLVENVLALARLERGAPGPALQGVAPDAVCAEVVERTRALVDGAGARMELRVAPGLSPVRADRDGLVQALSNLVDNAVKFSTDAADRTVHLTSEGDGDGVALIVRDHGPGVPAAQLDAIFDPFFRGERELTRRTQGTGIGLALVAGLVARAGGSVVARNHPEGGLEVVLRLRRA